MTIPAGRAIREVLDAMLLGFCEHHFAKTFDELDESDRIEVLRRFENELSKRAFQLTKKRRRAHARHPL